MLFGKRILVLFMAGIIFLASFPLAAQAVSLDFGKATCQDFLEISDEGSLVLVYGWIDGYLSAKSGDTNVDLGAFESNVTELAKACEQNPKANLLKTVQGQ